MTIPVPTFCRIEYWNAEVGEWHVGHAGTNLMDPEKYATKLGQTQRNRQGVITKNGTIARVIDVDAGIEYYTEGADLL